VVEPRRIEPLGRQNWLKPAASAVSPSGRVSESAANIGADLNPGGAGVWETAWARPQHPLIGGRYEP
jgi:hypothetical protein